MAALKASKGFIMPFTFCNLSSGSLVATTAAIADTTMSTAIIPPRYFATRLRSSLGILDKRNKDAASTPIAIEIAFIFAANPLPDLCLIMLFRLPRVFLISVATPERSLSAFANFPTPTTNAAPVKIARSCPKSRCSFRLSTTSCRFSNAALMAGCLSRNS